MLGVTLDARPSLRCDTFYADTEVGVQFSSTGPAFHLHGGSAFQLFERIAPFLDGSVTRSELQAAVGESRWSMVAGILLGSSARSRQHS